MSKRKKGTHRKQQQKRQAQMRLMGGGIIAVAAILGFLILAAGDNRIRVTFPDIHGMSFSGDGEKLWVSTHNGLVVYENGNWNKPDLPINDYMGYSGTADGFFSSGHPGPGSNFINPLGLVRSRDFGKTLTTINFAGQSDFHTMAASYYGDTVYVINPRQNSLLSTGMFYSLDGGETWEQSAGNGLTSAPIQITVHPEQSHIVAVATQAGVFFSEDYGDTFSPITSDMATSITFAPDGERFIYGIDKLFSYSLADKVDTPLSNSPSIDAEEAIIYIAVNPITEAIAIATTDRDIFYSPDNGETWEKIGENGVSQ